jgi:hypothetical protein
VPLQANRIRMRDPGCSREVLKPHPPQPRKLEAGAEVAWEELGAAKVGLTAAYWWTITEVARALMRIAICC